MVLLFVFMTKSRGIRVRRGTRQQWVQDEQGKHFCACGCNEPIPLRTEHFNTGIPKYRHGHNPPPPGSPRAKKEPPPRKPCECGCGELASPGRRYLVGHSSYRRHYSEATRRKLSEAASGERNGHYGKRGTNWKGGTTRTPPGYIHQWAPHHPHAKNNYVAQHRLVAEQHLTATDPQSPFLEGGYLSTKADVHHINHVKDDNRIENLAVMWRGDHTRLHMDTLQAARWEKRYADKWFNGDPWTLTIGADVEATNWRGLNSSLHRAARQRNTYVKLKLISPTQFTLQARDR
jgi:hypothetical protein